MAYGRISTSYIGPTSRAARVGAEEETGSSSFCCVIRSHGSRAMSSWHGFLLWILALAVVLFSLATVLSEKASIAGHQLWSYPPLAWLAGWEAWQLAAVAAFFAFVANWFVVPYFGRVVRYTRATPENIAARKNIRERGLALISELHKEDYSRIVVVGHSLGSILAYDIISYFWATRYDARTVVEGTPEFNALVKLEQAAADLARPNIVPAKQARAAFFNAQRDFGRSLRLRPRPTANTPDTRWLITDLVTLGSPLTHAEFLLAHSADDLKRHQADRAISDVAPGPRTVRSEAIQKAKAAGFTLDPDSPRLLLFPFSVRPISGNFTTQRPLLRSAGPISMIQRCW